MERHTYVPTEEDGLCDFCMPNNQNFVKTKTHHVLRMHTQACVPIVHLTYLKGAQHTSCAKNAYTKFPVVHLTYLKGAQHTSCHPVPICGMDTLGCTRVSRIREVVTMGVMRLHVTLKTPDDLLLHLISSSTYEEIP